MDINKLVEVLRATLEPAQREQAEQQLTEVHKIIGFAPTLLQVIMADHLEMPVRQAGVIYLKNLVHSSWEDHEAATPTDPIPFSIHDNDRQLIRDNIVEAIIKAPDYIRVQLGVCISHIIKADYPGRWPGVAEKVALYIQSDQHDTWLGALVCLYQLVKNYEYKKPGDRCPLNEAMQHLLPLIYQRCLTLMPDQSQPSVLLQKQILKIFFALVQYFLPLDLVTKEMFTQWMELVRQIVDRPVPESTLQVDEDERAYLVWWKCKKWALHILARVFERYGSPGNVMKEYKEFSEWYLKTFSVGILQVLMKILDQHRQKQYVAPRVLQQTLNYLNQGVGHAVSWKVMKPHMQTLTQDVLFPLMCHTDEDEELWESDPVEYIRTKYDVFEEFFSPVTAAQALLHTAVSKRKEVLQKTMGFVMQILTSQNLEPRQKAGALHVVGSVAQVLLKKKIYKSQAELMLVNHVFPEFQSTYGYLRARACWVLQSFAEVRFKNEANLVTATELLRGVLNTDKELPVRVEAALAIQVFLADQEKVENILRPHVRQLVLDILNILRETEIDDLTTVLQKIVCTYVAEVTPLAVEMTTHLAQTFEKVISSDTEGSDEKAISAMGILNTLDAIITVMEDQKEIIAHVEGIILNVVGLILQHSVIDFYEEVLSLISSLTTTHVSDSMWNVFPLIHNMFNGDGFDYFTDMMPALHNYVTVDPQRFISDPKHMEMIFAMCKRVLTSDAGEDAECHAAKMLEVILLQFKGQVDQVVPTFVEVALERLTREIKTSELRTMCLQVVIAALYYNPPVLLQTLQNMHLPNTTESIFGQFLTQWLHDTDCFLGLHDRKLCVLGLCTLLETPTGTRPSQLNEMANQILPALLIVFSGLKRAYASRAAEDDSDDDDEDGDDDQPELEDDDDDLDDEGQDYLDKLDTLEKSANGEESDEDEEDDDLDETVLESYDTPIDKEDCPVDEYQVFRNTLQTLEGSDPAWYTMITGQLTEEQRNQLIEVFKLAEQRRAASESKRIEETGGYVFQQKTVPSNFNFGAPQ